MISSKGGGVIELSGMEDISSKEGFNIIRPLLDYTKEEILSYLQNRKIKFFIDKSNFDIKYERNRFRPIVEEIVKIKGKKGFIRTFNILQKEAKSIKKGAKKIFKSKELIVAKIDNILFLDHYLSIYLKELNYLISFKEREAILKNSSIVVGRKWAVEIENNLLYIAPYIKTTLPKEFKEICRINKIPPKIRGYLYKENLCNILIDTIQKNYLL
ncbi:MAG: tRNA lysidine(34) synthetase TilS, partial [Epsilonproteobacteria bacterium]|nr:tRNA lysidine(34) synthetase TilS [Campylobacterota bacterium]